MRALRLLHRLRARRATQAGRLERWCLVVAFALQIGAVSLYVTNGLLS